MANPIIPKRSSVAAKVPLATDLQVGEIAVNLTDKKIYSKDASGTVIQLGGSSGSGGGSGDVVGPASSTNNSIPLFDGTTGKLLKSSSMLTVVDNYLETDATTYSGLSLKADGAQRGWLYGYNGGASNVVNLETETDTTLVLVANGTGSIAFYTADGLPGYAASERMRLDASGNLGLGKIPSVFESGYTTLQLPAGTLATYDTDFLSLSQNAREDGGYKYLAAGAASQYEQYSGMHEWKVAPAGTAGGAITYLGAMLLDNSGNLGIGMTPSYRLDVSSAATTVIRSYASAGNQAYVSVAGNAGVPGTSAFDLIQDGGGAAYLYNRANSFMVFGTNNTERARIDSSGNFGIGATSPQQKLHVSAGSGIPTALVEQLDTTGATLARFLAKHGSGSELSMVAGAGFATISTTTAIPLVFSTNNAEGMRLNATGLGVGTSSPSTALHVKRASGAQLDVLTIENDVDPGLVLVDSGNWSSRIFVQGSTGSLIFENSANTERMRLDASGNLGLGVTPSAWGTAGNFRGIQLPGASLFSDPGFVGLYANVYWDGSTDRYVNNGAGSIYDQYDGAHHWGNFASGTAGAAATYVAQMVLDANGNLGLGVTPSTWGSGVRALQIYSAGAVWSYNDGTNNFTGVSTNVSGSGGPEKYILNGRAAQYVLGNGTAAHTWNIAASGTAGAAISFTQAMTLDASGNLFVGATSGNGERLDVAGSGRIRGDLGVYTTTSDRLLVAPQPSGSGVLVRAVNNTNSAYTTLQLDGSLISFQTSAVEKMRLDASGNLNIGTTASAARLDVNSGTDTSIARFTGPANGFVEVTNGTGALRMQLLSNVPHIGSYTNHALNFVTNNAVRMSLDTAGKLTAVTPSSTTASINLPVATFANGPSSPVDGDIWLNNTNGMNVRIGSTTMQAALTGNQNTFSATQTFNGTIYGYGDVRLNSATTGLVNLGTALTAGNLFIGGTSQYGGITIGQSTDTHTLNIDSGATANAKTKTINFGANGVSGSTTAINIGSSVAGATTNITSYGTWSHSGSFSLNGATVSVASGGTGANNAGGARSNLGAQETLVSGTNIKTINGTSILGSGDLVVTGGSGASLSADNTFSGTNTFSGAVNSFGTSAAASTTNLGTGATTSGVTKTVNVGTGGLFGSTTNVNIGSASGGGTTVVYGTDIKLMDSDGYGVTVTADNAGAYIGTETGDVQPLPLYLGASNASQLTLGWYSGNYRVGIGTTSPQYPLDIFGDTNISGNLRLVTQSAEPGTPTGGAYLYVRETAPGNVVLKSKRPSGVDSPLQDGIAFNRLIRCTGSNNATTTLGAAAVTFAGTATAITPASGSAKAQIQRVQYASAATANAVTTHISPNAGAMPMIRGNVSGEGGFRYVSRFSIQAVAALGNFFTGIADTVTAASATSPNPTTSTTPGKVGLAFTTNTGNMRIVHNVTGTAPTVIDLGSNFPVDITSLYELVLYCRPHDGTSAGNISYRVRRYTTTSDAPAFETTGTLSTNLPAATTLLHPWGYYGNGGTAAAVSWQFSYLTIESDW